MLDRRKFVLSALTLPSLIGSAKQAISAPGDGMVFAMHQNTSSASGFRGSLEGWSRAGVEFVELNAALLDVFLENDSLPGARILLDDLGQTPICAAVTLPDLWVPGPARESSLDLSLIHI